METNKKMSPRKRVKGTLGKILSQMHFYFSDSNLAKDRFMKRHIDQDPDGYVDLLLFLTFNKIKTLADSIDLVVKALTSSNFLVLSNDKTKVKRKRPYKPPKDTDERTVYVECLPQKANHEWIENVFSSCGKVTYVSLPKYRSTGDSKGFAFVEFEDKESARKACEELNNPPIEAGDKPGKFPKTNRQIVNYKEKLESMEQDIIMEATPEEVTNIKNTDSPGKKRGKQKRRCSESSTDGNITSDTGSKRRLSSKSAEEKQSDSSANESSPKKRRKTQSRDSIDNSETVKDVGKVKSAEQSESVKSEEDTCYKKRKSQGRRSAEGKDIKECDKTERKTDCWKKKDIRSSEEGKESDSSDCVMRDLSHTRKRKHSERLSMESGEPVSKTSKSEPNETKDRSESIKEAKKKDKRKRSKTHDKEKCFPELRVISKKQWLELKNEFLIMQKQSMKRLKDSLKHIKEYKANQDKGQEMEVDMKLDLPKANIVEVPNVIVRVQNSEDMNRKQLKEDMGLEVNVAYIDIKDGQRDGYIRFKDAESAVKIADTTIKSYLFTMVTGEDEMAYWKKLKSDREAKHNCKSKKNKPRGAQKLLHQAEKINKEKVSRVHIKFEDD